MMVQGITYYMLCCANLAAQLKEQHQQKQRIFPLVSLLFFLILNSCPAKEPTLPLMARQAGGWNHAKWGFLGKYCPYMCLF